MGGMSEALVGLVKELGFARMRGSLLSCSGREFYGLWTHFPRLCVRKGELRGKSRDSCVSLLAAAWVLPEGDKTRRLQDFSQEEASATWVPPLLTSLLISFHLAPEPSSLAGKDKCDSHLPISMDHITRTRFQGQRMDLGIHEEWGLYICQE